MFPWEPRKKRRRKKGTSAVSYFFSRNIYFLLSLSPAECGFHNSTEATGFQNGPKSLLGDKKRKATLNFLRHWPVAMYIWKKVFYMAQCHVFPDLDPELFSTPPSGFPSSNITFFDRTKEKRRAAKWDGKRH